MSVFFCARLEVRVEAAIVSTSMTSTTGTRLARLPGLLAAMLLVGSMGFSAQATADDGPKACRSKLASLSDWLDGWARAMDRQPAFVPVPKDAELVAIDRPAMEVGYGETIVLNANGIYFPGGDVALDPPALTEHLRRSLASERKIGEITGQAIEPSPLLIAAHRHAPWRLVVDATNAAAAAGVTRALLLFRSSRIRRVSAPGPSAFDDPLREIPTMPEPSQRTSRVANLTDELVSSCPALRPLLAASTRRGGLAHKKIVAAIAKCGCVVDLSALATFLWAVRPPDPGTAVSIVLAPPESRDADVTLISAAASLPWSRAYTAVLPIATARQPRAVRLKTDAAPAE